MAQSKYNRSYQTKRFNYRRNNNSTFTKSIQQILYKVTANPITLAITAILVIYLVSEFIEEIPHPLESSINALEKTINSKNNTSFQRKFATLAIKPIKFFANHKDKTVLILSMSIPAALNPTIFNILISATITLIFLVIVDIGALFYLLYGTLFLFYTQFRNTKYKFYIVIISLILTTLLWAINHYTINKS